MALGFSSNQSRAVLAAMQRCMNKPIAFGVHDIEMMNFGGLTAPPHATRQHPTTL